MIREIDKKDLSIHHVIGAATDADGIESLTVNSRSLPVVANLDHVAQSVGELGVVTVIIAGQPGCGGHFMRDLGWDLEGTSAELVVASRLTNVAGPRIHFRPVEGLPLMHVELPNYEGGKHVLKRAMDVAAAAIALVLLCPLLLAIAFVIRRDSEGPVLFRQERVGRGGKTFTMLKFRSMVETAERDLDGLLDQNEGAGALFTLREDPRVTRAGRVLRRYSLDELPQLVNVVRGEMNLVGFRIRNLRTRQTDCERDNTVRKTPSQTITIHDELSRQPRIRSNLQPMSCIRFSTRAQLTAMRDARPSMVSDDTGESASNLNLQHAVSPQHPVPVVTESKLRRLHLLASDSNPKIRESAASSINTTPDLFEILSKDISDGVRCCVARNEHSPSAALRRLALDQSEQVRGFVALNHSTEPELLRRLAVDDSALVRSLVQWRSSAIRT